MPATMQSVTTRGFGISGGFAGSAGLVVTLGYGIGVAVEDERDATQQTPAVCGQLARSAVCGVLDREGAVCGQLARSAVWGYE